MNERQPAYGKVPLRLAWRAPLRGGLPQAEHEQAPHGNQPTKGGKPIGMIGQRWNSCFKGKIGLQAKMVMA